MSGFSPEFPTLDQLRVLALRSRQIHRAMSRLGSSSGAQWKNPQRGTEDWRAFWKTLENNL
jgi:hypothetical protein